MIEIYTLYLPSFFLALFAGLAFRGVGTHLVSRGEGYQFLALAQAALFGQILGGLFHLPLLGSLLTFILVRAIFHFKKMGNPSESIVGYLIFLALSYLVVSLFPNLDSHLSGGIFGDIVSLGIVETWILTGFFIFLNLFLRMRRKEILSQTLEISIFKGEKKIFFQEVLFSLALLTGIYGLGLLFTLCFMFFPLVINGKGSASFRSFEVASSLKVAFAAIIGLGISLSVERFPTVPTQVICLLVLLIMTFYYDQVRSKGMVNDG